MDYVCLIYVDEGELAALPAAEMDALNAAHHRFDDALVEAGQMIAAGALQPARASTCVRVRGGKRLVTDGPFAETKEQVAGFFLVQAKDLDEAISIAARVPAAALGTVEVRPLRPLVIEGKAHWCMERVAAAMERRKS
ncbi:MAG: YciI family protein [Usitatibacter sp.]